MKGKFLFSRFAVSVFLLTIALNANVFARFCALDFPFRAANPAFPSGSFFDDESPWPTPVDGGIRESIPEKYQERYRRWKEELLSTPFGQAQWEDYAANKNFILIISVTSDEKQGAGTLDYKWNETGELVGATINLGSKIDRGFPNPAYFPVMNSIAAFNLPDEIDGETLAAAKIAHEFGHVNSTRRTSAELFQRQNRLMPDYNKILLSNGYNTKDSRLLELSGLMGGTPVEIWENREYWGEANAMQFLLEKIRERKFYCSLVSKIQQNVKTFASDYEDRFTEITKTKFVDSCRR